VRLRAAGLLVAAAALVSPALADAATPTGPVFDGRGNLVGTPFIPEPEPAEMSEEQAERIFLAHPKIADWLDRYPRTDRVVQAEFEEDYDTWHVRVWWGEAGQIADGRVEDGTGAVTEAWTGPQVAWKMARGGPGAFGGDEINRPLVWLAFCVAFLLGLADWRRPLSLRNLDLLVLLSFTISLRLFNDGNVFASAALATPPLLYLIARTTFIGATNRVRGARSVWPVWVLVAATVFLMGFRVGLNLETSNVIDVGYAGVIGGHRIVNGEAPYGNFPIQGDRPACGSADREGEIRERIQTNGRCEASNDRGDTYGPVSYLAYVPGYLLFGWTGKWDDLPAAHFTSLAFDALCVLGLALVGFRFGGRRLAATLPFAWAAYPFTQYTSNSNTNDAILPAFLILGFYFAASPWLRAPFAAFAGWTKFAALIVAPLWATYPERRLGDLFRFAASYVAATLVAFSVLLLEPDLGEAVRAFWDRTLGWQLDRESPFSIWDWGQYHARGIPDLSIPHKVVQGLVVAGAVAAAFFPRRKSPLQLAALTAALLLGFQLVLTHWFYLYIPWFFPFVAIALLARDRSED
jgi:hypothetical protein